MKALLELQQKLLPELMEFMQKRYRILQYIRFMQPIGRRSLATQLDVTERILRSEVTLLKNQGLLDVSQTGMQLTEDGERLLDQLEDIMKEILGLGVLEKKLKDILQLDQVVVVSGDSDKDELSKVEMGRACVACMKGHYQSNNTIAVTGGTTMAAVAEMMTPDTKGRELLFVPARGGLGENVQNQANTICAKMAEQANGAYRLLHVPDQLSTAAYQSLTAEPSIRDVLALIKTPTMVVHGIGNALTMAERRKTSHEDFDKIHSGKAVAESFGYYFDSEGNIVHRVTTVGLQLEDLQSVQSVIATAGGASKASAIMAYMKQNTSTILITDEGAAQAIVRDYSLSS
ncbi:sugar-binding domain-containing protein [Bacillus tianshenii]|nr:sugar-binding domain-containing protein [Bacillus tianshenii]